MRKTEHGQNTYGWHLGIQMTGTAVGWAATEQDGNLKRIKGQDAWGVRTYPKADTAKDRRGFRSGRRNNARAKARRADLMEFFKDAINEVDENFYERLSESMFRMEERSESNKQPNAVFADPDYTDADYYKDYPTIAHLKKELIENPNAHDVRLVFLAVSHSFKHRGHFYNFSLTNDGESFSVDAAYDALREEAERFNIHFPALVGDERKKLDLLFRTKESKTHKAASVSDFLGVPVVDGKIKPKKEQKSLSKLIQLACGCSCTIGDVYGKERFASTERSTKICFSDSKYEETEEVIENIVGTEYFSLILAAKELYDAGCIASILRGEKYLANARVKMYEQHKDDLALLKKVYRHYKKSKKYGEYFKKREHEMFDIYPDEKGVSSYSAYVCRVSDKKKGRAVRKAGRKNWTQKELYKTIKNDFEKIEETDRTNDVKEVLKRIDAEDFLPKQMSSANAAIPNQLAARELKAILDNAAAYLPFLNKKGESGLPVKDEIMWLFTWRMPYYVGPLGQEYLNKKGYNVWAPRIASGHVYPWNLEQKIDVRAAGEEFINRMVGHCSYMTQERALPKNSLLYERFALLNEVNALRVYGERLSPVAKQKLVKTLFADGKNVTTKRLESYLIHEGILKAGDELQISGINTETGFTTTLSSYAKFCRLLGKEELEKDDVKMVEEIIFWLTIYSTEKKIVFDLIKESYGYRLSDDAIKNMARLTMKGWGTLSRSFLEMKGRKKNTENELPLIDAMWEANVTLMELMSGDYTYRKELDKRVQKLHATLDEYDIDDLDAFYLSPAEKRMVLQTIKVCRELVHDCGNAPSRIFVEVQREKTVKKSPKDIKDALLSSVRTHLRSHKDNDRDWVKEINDHDVNDFRNRKLVLYYSQMGRSAYTGRDIPLDQLMDPEKYNIDHIYPQHYARDDSPENNLVLVETGINRDTKKDIYPLDKKTQEEMSGFWKSLAAAGLISAEKYRRLTRTVPLSNEEKASFINSQFTETRRGTKALTQIFKDVFPNSVIVFSKAELISDFRQEFRLTKAVGLNELYHAHDAYLNAIVGNAYYEKFTANPLKFILRSLKDPNNSRYHYNLGRFFRANVVSEDGRMIWCVDEGKETINEVRRVLKKPSVIVSRKLSESHKLMKKTTLKSAEFSKGKTTVIPLKSSDPRFADVGRYGGMDNLATSGYVIYDGVEKGKEIRLMCPVPTILGRYRDVSDARLLDYLREKYPKLENISIVHRNIFMGALIRVNGVMCYLGGKNGSDGAGVTLADPLYLSDTNTWYFKKLDKAVATKDYSETMLSNEERVPVITKERNCGFYEEVLWKLTDGPYRKLNTNVKQILTDGKEKFEALSISEQCVLLRDVILWINGYQHVNLVKVGGSQYSGTLKIGSNVSNMEEFVLVHTSTAGLTRREVDLKA